MEPTSYHLPAGYLLKGLQYTYRIVRVLGQGSFGITYLANLQLSGALGALNVHVAVKEFFMKELNGREGTTVTSGSKGGLFDKYRDRFAREAQNLAMLKDHTHIVNVLESFVANNTAYYAMEYIDGCSLDDYIARRGALTEAETLRLVAQIGDALAYMHSHKMLHLDLKPGNIMLRSDGTAVLIDFGLSKQYDELGVPESSTTIGGGTPGYAPIEQAQYHEGRGFPTTMDVYALGATMFKMLTGQRPPEAADILNEGFPVTALQQREVSANIISCIEKAMSPMKVQRYQTTKEFLMASQVSAIGTKDPKKNEETIFSVPWCEETITDSLENASSNETKEEIVPFGAMLFFTFIVLCLIIGFSFFFLNK